MNGMRSHSHGPSLMATLALLFSGCVLPTWERWSQGLDDDTTPADDDDDTTPAGDDDDTTPAGDDDDTSHWPDDDDDALGPPLYSTEGEALSAGLAYTVFFFGTVGGAPSIESITVADNQFTPAPGHPAVRYVHGASTEGMVDVFVDGARHPEISSLGPTGVWPNPWTTGYSTDLDAGTHGIDVCAPGENPLAHTPIVGDFDEVYDNDFHYTVVFTGPPQARFLARSQDDPTTPSAGHVRLRVFNAIEDSKGIDVVADTVKCGTPLCEGLLVGEFSATFELPAETYFLHVR